MRALITGVTGQDGSYLADLLLAKGYEVFGVVRRTSADAPWRLAHLEGHPRLRLVPGDVLDAGSLCSAVEEAAPDEVYHLAAQSFVGRSWREPELTAEVTGLGALRLLEAVRRVAPRARVYQASTSEMYGEVDAPAGPDGPFRPRSPYGSAKLFAHHTAINYRESYGMFVSTGILFNHESPRRGLEFVTRKVCRAAAQAAADPTVTVRLGNLEARRDWGWAPEYVEAMWRMLQAAQPMDLVVATGESRSVRELCELAFAAVGRDWRDHVVADEALLRPADIAALVGDPAGARRSIGWEATVRLPEIVSRMVEAA